MSEDVFIDMLEDDSSEASDTPEVDEYIGTHETHRINGLTIYDRAKKLERERDEWKSRVIAFNNQAERAVRSLETLEQERDRLRARVAELEGALRWYVDNDETFGDDDNGFWATGQRRAIAVLAKKEADKA